MLDIWERIPYAAGAAWNETGQQASRCVEGTREKLLQQITDWAGNPRKPRTIKLWMRRIQNTLLSQVGNTKEIPMNEKVGFWLGGLAGTGKSTVARTIAEDLSKRRDSFTVASFFFRRGTKDRADTGKFVTTILRQIAKRDTSLKDPLLEAFEDHGSQQLQLASAWRDLIQTPLSGLRHKTILLVIDAIDESRETMANRYEMFDLLSDASNFEGLNMRVFVTARPQEEKILEDLHDVFHLHKVPEDVVEGDLRKFLRVKFTGFNNQTDGAREFPTPSQIDALASRSAPLFIAAMTSFRFITQNRLDPQSQYNILMSTKRNRTSSQTPEDEYLDLDNMYMAVILKGLKEWTGAVTDVVATFKSLVGSAITMCEPLSARELGVLLSIDPGQVRALLKAFREVLDVSDDIGSPLRVFHQSFPEFLTSPQRVVGALKRQGTEHGCNERLWVDEEFLNHRHLNLCLDLMEGASSVSGLTENICELKGPGALIKNISKTTIKRHISPTLRYACKHWASHFVSGLGQNNAQDYQRLLGFLKKHLLHWIEAMSCLNNLNNTIRALDQVHESLIVRNYDYG